MKRVYIDPGHGGTDSGACHKKMMEKTVNLAIAWRIRDYLEQDNVMVFMSRVMDKYVTLTHRWDMANALRVDAFISIHCNADADMDGEDDPIAKGEEIWIRSGCLESMKLAQCIQKYVSTFANVNRGIKETERLAVLRNTEMAAVLVEVGFVDDPEFSDDPPVEAASQGISEGIKEYLKGISDGTSV